MVSIITVCYNSEKYIEKCIQSIIRQDSSNFEHIIIDGCSKDTTLDIIKKYDGKYNMKWISEPDKGMYDALSKGFRMAKGEIIAWINSDDTYMPWAVRTMEYVMNNYPRVFWCTGLPSSQSDLGFPYVKDAHVPCYSRKFILNGWHHGRGLGFIQQESTFWRKEVMNEVNLEKFSSYKAAGDYYLWKTFASKYNLYSINTTIGCFRSHEGQISENISGYFKEIREDYGPLKLMIWGLNKLFGINRIYYYINREKLIHVKPQRSIKQRIKTTINIHRKMINGN